MRLTIRLKFILLVGGLMLLTFAGITFTLIQRNTTTLKNNLNTEAKAFASLATKPIGDVFALYKDSGRILIGQQIARFTELDPNITNVAVVDTTGRVIYQQNEDSSLQIEPMAAASLEATYINNARGNLTGIVYPYLENNGLHRYSLFYQVSNASINSAVRSAVQSITGLSVAALLLSCLLIFLFVDWLFLNPLRNLSQNALAISAGNLSQTIKLMRHDEIGDLAESLENMANALKADIAKLKEVDELKTEFMVISSHNLRTPLSIIRGFLENLRYQKLNAEAQHKIEVISAQSSRLLAFTEDMLVISQIEAGKETLDMQPFELNKFVEPMLYEFGIIAQQKNIAVVKKLAQHKLMVQISLAHFRTAIWNILDNALKFSKEKGTITVTTQLIEGKASISIADTGIGIDPKEVSKLFTKFHRGTDVMRYNYEGMGIGLYITKLIIDRHQGTIAVRSELGKGSTFTITLPLSSEAAHSE